MAETEIINAKEVFDKILVDPAKNNFENITAQTTERLQEEQKKNQEAFEQYVQQQKEKRGNDELGDVEPFLSSEQAFLLDYTAFNFSTILSNNNFKLRTNWINQLDSEITNEKFISEVCGPDGFDELVNIRPIQYARLIPSIELYKIFYSGESVIGQEQFVFNNYTNLSDIEKATADRTFRGDGAGIKDLSIDLVATNQANYATITAKLTLMFQDIQTIFNEKESFGGSKISYADLLTSPIRKDGDVFGIRMILGYNNTESVFEKLDTKYNRFQIALTFKSHSIELQEDSSCKVVVEYVGWIEMVLNDPSVCNLFKPSSYSEQLLDRYDSDIDTRSQKLEKDKKDMASSLEKMKVNSKEEFELVASSKNNVFLESVYKEQRNKLESLIDKDSEIKTQEETLKQKIDAKQVITKNLRLQNLKDIFSSNLIPIFKLSLSQSMIIAYKSALSSLTADDKGLSSFFSLYSKVSVPIVTNPSTISDDQFDFSKKLTSGDILEDFQKNKTLKFVLFKDLLEQIFSFLSDDIKKVYRTDVEILLGSIVFRPPGNTNTVRINLGYIPISLSLLNNFIVDKFVGRSQTVYTFYQFIKDIIEEFLVKTIQTAETLNPHYDNSSNAFKLAYLPITKNVLKNKYSNCSVLSPENTKQSFFIYATSQTVDQANSSYEENIKNKIPHFFFAGMDRGITKSVKLSEITDGKFKSAIWEQFKSDQEHADTTKWGGYISPAIYTADLELMGYPYIMNGAIIYVDTSLIGLMSDRARQLLLGGYYSVNKVSHNFSSGQFSTKLSATFVSKDATKKSPLKIITEKELLQKSMSDKTMEGIR